MQPWSKTLFQPFFCSWGCIYIWTPYLIQHMVKWNKFWLQTYYFMIIILSSEYYGRERHTHTILKGLRVFINIQSFYLKHLFNMTLTLNKCLKVRHILIYNRLQIRAMDMNIVFRKSWPQNSMKWENSIQPVQYRVYLLLPTRNWYLRRILRTLHIPKLHQI